MRILRISHSAVVDTWRERERELRALGHRVHLISAKSWNEAGAMMPLQPRAGEDLVGVRTVGSHPALFLYAPRPLWRALAQEWDVLDIHEEPYALCTVEILVLRRLRRLFRWRRAATEPYVVYSAQNIEKSFPWPFNWLERRVLRHAGAISVCNREAGEIARRKGLRGEVALIPLGIDPRLFHIAAPSPEVDDRLEAAGQVRVAYAGRLTDYKGVPELLDAIDQDPRLTLTLAGDGPLAAKVRARVASSGGRMHLAGVLENTELAEFYQRADVLAVPSRTTSGWVEQFGRVAVEAMACGTPVVAAATGALPDVVGGAGVLIPERDPAALRDALLEVGTDPALAGNLRSAGLARAATCTWAAVAQQYADLYRRIIETKGSPPTVTTVAAPTQSFVSRGAETFESYPRAGESPDHAVLDPQVPDPEVMVVAYGSPELLAAALAPLAGRFSITVVDNSSRDDVRQVVQSVGASYVDPGSNLGFAAGVNVALAHRKSLGADILLLNPDARVAADDVRRLHRALRADRALASVGPAQVDADGVAAKVGWPFPTPMATWVEAVGLGKLRRPTGFVIGSILLVKAEALADVGSFDERFFLYSEETDWAYRARSRGWRHEVVKAVIAEHRGAATHNDSLLREAQFHASQEIYFRKHFGSAGWQVARSAVIAGAAARSLVLRPGARPAHRTRLATYLRGPVRTLEDAHARAESP